MKNRFISCAAGPTRLRHRSRSSVFPNFAMENGVIPRSHPSPALILIARRLFRPMESDYILDRNAQRLRTQRGAIGIFGSLRKQGAVGVSQKRSEIQSTARLTKP